MLFENRIDAGKQLASHLTEYQDRDDVIVLALPRGGVPVAYPISKALRLPLDVFLVRKLGVPGHEEYAFGAVASGGVRVLNAEVVRSEQISDAQIEETTRVEQLELERRDHVYRGDRPMPSIEGNTVIVVDDGLATGATMRAAVVALRKHHPAKIVVAVPAAAEQTCDAFRDEVDQIICAATPDPFYGVGMWYHDFSQTTDDEVRDLLARASSDN